LGYNVQILRKTMKNLAWDSESADLSHVLLFMLMMQKFDTEVILFIVQNSKRQSCARSSCRDN